MWMLIVISCLADTCSTIKYGYATETDCIVALATLESAYGPRRHACLKIKGARTV